MITVSANGAVLSAAELWLLGLHLAGSRKPGLNFIDHEEDIVTSADLLAPGQVTIIRDEDTIERVEIRYGRISLDSTFTPTPALPEKITQELTQLLPGSARPGTQRPRGRTVPDTLRDLRDGCT
jgi:hypothetical protein